MTHLGAPVPPSAETLSFAAQAREVHWNLSRADLVAWSLRLNEGELSAEGALVARTGEFTGRSPKDKFTVRDALTESKVDWGTVNQAISPEHYDKLEALMEADVDVADVEAEDGKITVFAPHTEFFKAKQALAEAFGEIDFDVNEIQFIKFEFFIFF